MKDEPITVKNRDILTLANVLYVMQDVKSVEQRRLWQQDRIFNITQKITGMPGGGGVPKGLDDTFAAISELEETYRESCQKYVRVLKAAEEVLNGIASPSMRTFVTMKYMLDMPNQEIMRSLNMSEWAFRKARETIEQAQDMAHVQWRERYILKN